MTTWYVDSSAALKLVLREAESSALIDAIGTIAPRLVSCVLLETELRRAAHRAPALSQRQVSSLLDRITLYDMPAGLFTQAGLLPGTHLRSLDALHVAAALTIDVDALLTYDHRMIEAAADVGVPTLTPAP